MMGSNAPLNIASNRRGEAWHTSHLCNERVLAKAVGDDLSRDGSRLRKIMMGKWRDATRVLSVKSIAEALNAKASPEQIANLISASGRGNEIIFDYTKADGDSTTRHVTIEGFSGCSIRAIDHKDGTVKSFRIDRITKAHES